MSNLALISMTIGLLLLAWHSLILLCPKRAAAWITAFPRSKWPGRLLAAIDIGWTVALLLSSNYAWVQGRHNLVLLLAAVSFVFVIFFMDDLLSVRALGGLLLLAPAPMLRAAFIQQTQARLLVVVLAYIFAVLGIVLVWSPFAFRKITRRWISKPLFVRIAGSLGSIIGLGFIVLGLFVY